MYYMNILPPLLTCDIGTFITDCVLINISVTPLALLCNCIDVVCLSSALVGRVFLFGGFRCVYICFWSCFDLLVYICVCVFFTVPLHIRFLLVSSFSQVCLLEWGIAFKF